MKFSTPTLLLFLALLFSQCQSATEPAVTPESQTHLGSINIDISANEQALPVFKEGLLLLHSFEYEDAAEKFAAARQLDSNCVMAYWGEAMTKNHPLWNQQETEAARTILQQLAPTPAERIAKAPTDFEKDMLQGTEILFAEGDKFQRDDEYRQHMENLYQKYPHNQEIAAFYALSLLGSVEEGRDYEVYGKGAAIAKSILSENPNHPGALHYLIHANDDPENAKSALAAANSYAKVAPDAEHALHMPSHIYVALGMWDEVIKSNIASWEASVSRMTDKGLDDDARGYHAFKWLLYGYLQKGNYEKAKALLYDMKNYCEAKPSKRARAHLVMMKGAYLAESGNWDDPIASDTMDLADLNIPTKAVQYFIAGMSLHHRKDTKGMETVISTLQKEINETKDIAFTQGTKMCGGSFQALPTQQDIDQARVIALELRAMLAQLQQKDQEVEALLQQATVLEATTTFMYGPPDIVKPSAELYGEWLLTKNKTEEAKVQFKKVLVRAPGRLLASKGAAGI